MDKHWDSYCGLSIVHFLAFPDCMKGDGPIMESVDLIAQDDFFSGIEITRINDLALRRQVAQLIEQTHLKVDFGAHPMILGDKLNLNSLDGSERASAIRVLESFMDQAVELGAKRYVVLSGPDPGEEKRAAATDALIDSLHKLCDSAHKHQLSVVLETFDRKVDKKSLIGPAEEALAVSKTLRKDFPDFSLLYDMGHMVLLEETPHAAMGILKDHLSHIHVGNAVKVPGRPSYGDMHPRFGFPGSANDVPELVEFLDALFAIGYLSDTKCGSARPGVGFEIRPQPGETAAAILANLKRAWREAWPQVRNS